MRNKPEGRAKGGVARATVLSPEQKSAIAKKAATARWGKKTPKIINKGNFLDELGVDVPCYVLDDERRTAVISQIGMARSLGLSPRGNAFQRFISSKTMEPYVGAELRHKVENVVKFQIDDPSAGKGAITAIHGFEAEVLVEVCQSIIAASAGGALRGARYQDLIQHAQIVLSASAKLGIRQLVYALSGYSPTTEEVINAFKAYVQEEAKKYEPEFPNELYVEWHRLYEIPVPGKGKPWHFKHLTVRHIYYPLAKSQGKLLTLLRAQKAGDGDRGKKLFQFLNEVGARALRMHLGRVLEMAENSPTREDYERRITQRFGDQQELNLVPMNETSES